jgi:signal transduction histidine kinase
VKRWSSTRSLQVGFVVLLAVCAAQVGWWVIDQRLELDRESARLEERIAADVRAAGRLQHLGISNEALEETFATLDIGSGGEISVDPSVRRRFQDVEGSRIRRYLWEGGFFLVVLIAGMGVLWRALREEAILRRRQENFIASVGHEFKSPLAGIRLAVETLMMRDPPSDSRRRLLERVLEELDRLEGMVTNLLDAARIEDGHELLEVEPLEAADVIQSAVHALAERAGIHGIELHTEVPPGLVLAADRDAIQRVLHNLLDNAIRAVRDAEPRRITVSARRENGTIAIEVRDTGRGFASIEAQRLFDKFYRPGDEMRRAGRGSGLGLYIVRQLVERSGGSVRAESEGPGRGACFTIHWPGELIARPAGAIR